MISRDAFIKTCIEKVSMDVFQLGFSINKLDLKDERYVQFMVKHNEMVFYYGMNFLRNDSIDEKIGISNHKITEIVQKSKVWKPSQKQKQWVWGRENLATLANPDNSDGFFNSNYYENIKFDLDNPEKALIHVFSSYKKNSEDFILKTMNKFNLLTKVDEYINNQAFKKDDIPLLFFSGSIHKQLLVGMIISYLTKRDDHKHLVETYCEYMRKFDPSIYPTASDFNKILKIIGDV